MLTSRRVFLSHKHVDKPRVRDFAATLQAVGLEPWFDEDDMPASAELERRLLAGVQASSAVVFFVTPAFKDEAYISAEINYALQERRRRNDAFSIVTLVFPGSDGLRGEVPQLLRSFVWKEPRSDLEALRLIIEALPLELGRPEWRVPHEGCSYIRVAVEPGPFHSAGQRTIRVRALNLSTETIYLRGQVEIEIGSDRLVHVVKADATGRELLGVELRPNATLEVDLAADELKPFAKRIGRVYFVDAMNRRYFSDDRSPHDALQALRAI
jgi:hypothetical protein